MISHTVLTVTASDYPLIDIGANLTHDSFDQDRQQCIARATQANVVKMVITGSDLQESKKAIDLACSDPVRFSATAGIHPHYADQYDDATETTLRQMADNPQVVAVGETGLDFFRDISARDKQQQSFIAHLELAKKVRKPLFLHQRDAHATFHSILKEHQAELPRVVVHCFTDTAEALQEYLDLDCYIGITGWICDERRGKHLLECVHTIPLNRLMIETDAPYLLPRTLKPKPRTRRNEPCTLPEVLRQISRVRPESEAEIATQTTQNAITFFDLDSVDKPHSI